MLLPPICAYCAYSRHEEGKGYVCEAFPDGIPMEIIMGYDHRVPFGDEKILFKKKKGINITEKELDEMFSTNIKKISEDVNY
mgnify:CR=1 FL=1